MENSDISYLFLPYFQHELEIWLILVRMIYKKGPASWTDAYWLLTTHWSHAFWNSPRLTTIESTELNLSTIWSYPGRRYWIGIFGRRAAKRVKNPGEKLYTPLVQSSEVPAWHSAECRVPLRHFAPVVRKISFQNFLPLLANLRPKIPIRYFRPGCDYFPIPVLSTSGVANGGGGNVSYSYKSIPVCQFREVTNIWT